MALSVLAVEVANPGDFCTTAVGDTPVIVTRDADGEIYAFENCCAHRGALITLEQRGNVKDFSCVYHGLRPPDRRRSRGDNRARRVIAVQLPARFPVFRAAARRRQSWEAGCRHRSPGNGRAELRQVGAAKAASYAARRVGQTADVVVIGGGAKRRGLTEDYLEIDLADSDLGRGERLDVVLEVREGVLFGVVPRALAV